MNGITGIIVGAYRVLLKLYPRVFRYEFEEQMILDFFDFVNDADRKGKFALLGFCIREFVDFPLNVLKAHFREGVIFRKLRSQPVNTGIRGALGFGLGFACNPVWISSLLYFIFDPTIVYLSARVYTMIQIGVTDLLWVSSFVIFLAVNSIMFGFSIALFLGNRSNFSRYVIVGALCWVIPEILSYVLVYSLSSEYYQNKYLTPIIGYSMLLFIGTFLSAMYPISQSQGKKPLKYLAAGLLVYPLGTYLFIKFLSLVWSAINPWFSISLTAFVVTLIAGVFAMVMSNNSQQTFMVLAGACGYFILNHVMFYVAHYILGHSIVVVAGIAPDVLITPFYHMAVYKGVLGVIFGLVLGLMFGNQIKNNQLLIAAEN